MPGGRPRLYTSVEEVEEIIDNYFLSLDSDEIATISGLAMALGMSTETLREYAKKDEFSGPIKKARQKVETSWEKALLRGGSGPIFWLKNNAGWRDKREHTVDGKMKVSKVEYVIEDPKGTSS